MRRHADIPGLALTLALLVASLASGLAHRLPLALADPALFAYAQAGGEIAHLCGDGGAEVAIERPCDYCRLTQAALPTGPGPCARAPWRRAASPLMAGADLPLMTSSRAPSARAPPRIA